MRRQRLAVNLATGGVRPSSGAERWGHDLGNLAGGRRSDVAAPGDGRTPPRLGPRKKRILRQALSRNDAIGLGGTGDPPVLGGNLPPSRTHDGRSPFNARVVRTAVGRVARQNGPVARSTRNSIAWFRLSRNDAAGNRERRTAAPVGQRFQPVPKLSNAHTKRFGSEIVILHCPPLSG